jgi:glutathione S-transferase
VSIVLHGHPFSSYCQKVTIAFYETGVPFEWHKLESAEDFTNLRKMWPIGLMPMAVDGESNVVESSIIIERYAPQLVPSLDVRFLDRFFDLYVMTPMQKIVGDALRPEGERDPRGVSDARARLDVSYQWIDEGLKGRQWAMGDAFSLADCAAAPALFYADWAHPIPEALANTRAFRARLLAQPSVKLAVDEARPYRPYFPLGAPDRD